jgi:CRISPR system Cascade subunit CasD
MKRHLLLRLEAPLMAFGAVAVDAHGPVDDIPAPSLLTGLIANALGWNRTEAARLQRLQDRLRLATRRDREGERVPDYQTAELFENEKGWTTFGSPEGREKSPTYEPDPRTGRKHLTHIRHRWYDADAAVTVALRLEPADEPPTLDEVAAALDRPARPLFLGRKPCLPSGRLVIGFADAENCAAALALAPPADGSAASPRCFWPAGEGPEMGARRRLSGRRLWRVNVHAGEEVWWEGPAPTAHAAS